MQLENNNFIFQKKKKKNVEIEKRVDWEPFS